MNSSYDTSPTTQTKVYPNLSNEETEISKSKSFSSPKINNDPKTIKFQPHPEPNTVVRTTTGTKGPPPYAHRVTSHSPRRKHTGVITSSNINCNHFQKYEIPVESNHPMRKNARPGRVQARFELGDKSSQKFEKVLCDLERVVDESIKQQEKNVQTVSQRRQTLIEKRDSMVLQSDSLEKEIKDVTEELEFETSKYLSIISKKTEMQEKRMSLREQLNIPRRVSIILKDDIADYLEAAAAAEGSLPVDYVEKPAATVMEKPTSSPEKPSSSTSDHSDFENAYESIWSTLVYHSGTYLLEEGIKQAKVSRGFWLIHFSSIQSVITTWKTGSQLPIEYISSDKAKHHSGGDEEFCNMVANYDLEKLVCYIMVVDLTTSIACSWGTIDINGNTNTHAGVSVAH